MRKKNGGERNKGVMRWLKVKLCVAQVTKESKQKGHT